MPSTPRDSPGLICDLHCDTILELQGGADLASNPGGHVDLARLRRGRVGLQVFACFVPSRLSAARAHQEANAMLDVLDAACQRHPDEVRRRWSAR
jgi:microsomal dipeptidase-like Zn-dependent dipeptidase